MSFCVCIKLCSYSTTCFVLFSVCVRAEVCRLSVGKNNKLNLTSRTTVDKDCQLCFRKTRYMDTRSTVNTHTQVAILFIYFRF